LPGFAEIRRKGESHDEAWTGFWSVFLIYIVGCGYIVEKPGEDGKETVKRRGGEKRIYPDPAAGKILPVCRYAARLTTENECAILIKDYCGIL